MLLWGSKTRSYFWSTMNEGVSRNCLTTLKTKHVRFLLIPSRKKLQHFNKSQSGSKRNVWVSVLSCLQIKSWFSDGHYDHLLLFVSYTRCYSLTNYLPFCTLRYVGILLPLVTFLPRLYIYLKVYFYLIYLSIEVTNRDQLFKYSKEKTNKQIKGRD